jgi:excisionase family DNA binding protein
MNDMVSVKDASQYLGVSASTFKRVCEKHSIPLVRTAGGHRRIDREDLDRAYGVLWQGPHRKRGAAESTDHGSVRQVVDLLLQGSVSKVVSLISSFIDRPEQIAGVLESTLIGALWTVGDMWRSQQIDVYQEHICTNTTCTVLDVLLQRMPPVDIHAAVAVGGTFEGNFDTVATKMVCLILQGLGIRAIDLGCNLPAASIVQAAIRNDASLVWICHTHINNAETILHQHHLLRQTLPRHVGVLVGGGGLSPSTRRSLSDCQYFESLSLMADAITTQHNAKKT